MPALALLSPKVWFELALAAIVAWAGWYGYTWVYERGADSIQRKWDAVEAERAQLVIAQQQAAIKAQAELQAKADQLRRDKDAQINNINASLAAALDGLRNRPDRPGPGNLPASPGAGSAAGCTGSELFKPDAGFLSREAARADELRAELQQCQAQYNELRQALKTGKTP